MLYGICSCPVSRTGAYWYPPWWCACGGTKNTERLQCEQGNTTPPSALPPLPQLIGRVDARLLHIIRRNRVGVLLRPTRALPRDIRGGRLPWQTGCARSLSGGLDCAYNPPTAHLQEHNVSCQSSPVQSNPMNRPPLHPINKRARRPIMATSFLNSKFSIPDSQLSRINISKLPSPSNSALIYGIATL